MREKLSLPPGYTCKWSGEYEFELRAKQQLKIILPIVFFVIFLLLYMVFHSVTETLVLLFPTFYAMTGGLLLHWLLGYNFSVTFGSVISRYSESQWRPEWSWLSISTNRWTIAGAPLRHEDIEAATIEGAVQRLRPKLMTVAAVLASLIPILWERGVGSDIMKPIAAPIVGGMITSTIHVLILVRYFSR